MSEHASREITQRELRFVPRGEVLAAFATAPVLDADQFRRVLDAAADQDPFSRDW
ncbi:MAG TPA: hypothetical protein VFM37_07400 [Pseudonocardiaceae bacterium]|nr:hypothetical protein [Pseudonocardiaceae bacterium]